MVTNTDGSQKPCVFPFLVTGRTESGVNVTYDTCTNILDPDDRFWCSTKVRKHSKILLRAWIFSGVDIGKAMNL